MSFEQFLEWCMELDISFSLEERELRLFAEDQDTLTEDVVNRIRERKEELIDWLHRQQNDRGIPRVVRGSDMYPLSYGQQRMWLIDQMEGGSSHYNIPMLFATERQFDLGLAEQALQIIVKRHESLRSTFHYIENTAGQKVRTINSIHIRRLDFSRQSTPVESAMDEAKKIIKQSFDLESDLMLRAAYLKLPEQRGILILTLHHIAADAWSLNILADEFFECYQSLKQGRGVEFPELPLQYIDYASWQRNLQLDEQLSYWQEQLQGAPNIHSFPIDHPRPQTQSFVGLCYESSLPYADYRKLKQLANEEGVTLFMLLHAAYSILLSRYSQENDIVLGTPVANRNRKEFESMIGYFSNTLALRTTYDSSSTFKQYLKYVRDVNLDAQKHQDIPFEQLLSLLNLERTSSYSPLVQLTFSMDTAAQSQSRPFIDGLKPIDPESVSAKYELSLNVEEGAEGLQFHFVYNIDIFETASIKQLASSFICLLQDIVKDAKQLCGKLDIVNSKQKQQLLARASGIDEETEPYRTLVSEFRESVRLYPQHIALQVGDESITYEMLDKQSDRLARILQKGINCSGTLIGICLHPSVELITSILAVLKAGAAYLPLDPDYPQERLNYLINDSQVKVVVTDDELKQNFVCDKLNIMNLDDLMLDEAANLPPLNVELCSSDLAYVIYTSGSTGQPKGVMVEHKHVNRLLTSCGEKFNFDPNDVWVLAHSFAFDFSVWEIWGALLTGAKLVLAPKAVIRDVQAFYQLVKEREVTILNQTPSSFETLIKVDMQYSDQLSVRFVILGGEAVNFAKLGPWYERYSAQNSIIVNMYGITETTVHVTYLKIEPSHIENQTGSLIGEPLKDLSLYLLDNQLQLVPDGVCGEIYVGGAGVTRGYLNRINLTSEHFIENPYGCGRLYKTGDLARYTIDGLVYEGRSDSQVKLRGFRIETGEIESKLTEFDDISEARVLLRKLSSMSEQLVAYIIPEDGVERSLDQDRIFRELRRQLPEYMVPAFLVELEAIPLTINGKIDINLLPLPTIIEKKTQNKARTPLEEELRIIWDSVLPVVVVDVELSFFSYGGDSLSVLNLVSALSQKGFNVSVHDIFKYSTIRKLAQAIESTNTTRNSEVTELKAFDLIDSKTLQHYELEKFDDIYPISTLQLGMLTHSLVKQNVYNVVESYILDGQFDSAHFKTALKLLTERHEVLRTVFDIQSDLPKQLVLKSVEVEPVIEDLCHLPRNEQLKRIKDSVERFRYHDYDLSRPLWFCHIYKLSEQQFNVFMIHHHAILDGWSVSLLNTEMLTILRQLQEGKQAQLGNLQSSYSLFVANELSAMKQVQEEFSWFDDLSDPIVPHWTAKQFGENSYIHVDLDEFADAISSQAIKLNVSAKAILLSVHLRLLCLLNGTSTITTSVVCHGRPMTPDADRVLGLFLNSLPMAMELKGNSWMSLCKKVESYLSELQIHRFIPGSYIAKQFDLDLSGSLFNYANFKEYERLTDSEQFHVSEQTGGVSDTNYSFCLNFDHSKSKSKLSALLMLNDVILEAVSKEFVGDYLKEIMTQAITATDSDICNIPLLSQKEIELLSSFKETHQCAATEKSSFGFKLTELMQKYPENLAVVDQTISINYSQLHRQVSIMVDRLKKIGVQHQDVVGVFVDRTSSLVVSIISILTIGAIYVPLDKSHPRERLDYIINDSSMKYLITDEVVSDLEHCDALTHVPLKGDGSIEGSQSNIDLPVALNAPGYIIYTSGSTGKPKGVVISQLQLMDVLESVGSNLDVTSNDWLPCLASQSFDISLLEMLLPIYFGGTTQLIEREQILDFSGLIETTSKATILHAVPSLMSSWLCELKEKESNPYSRLRMLLVGGDAVPKQLLSDISSYLPDVELIELYGPTETTIISSCFRPAEYPMLKANHCIGKAFPHANISIVDPWGNQTPIGVPGEIVIGGAGVGLGYLNRPEMTARHFVNNWLDQKSTGNVYKTGDLGRFLPDGNIEFLGRIDDQVKIRGFRVELGEIEHCLQQLPEIDAATVIVREEEPENKHLVAYIVAAKMADLTSKPLTTYAREVLRKELPSYMVPAHFLELQTMPLTPNGKVDRKSLTASRALSVDVKYVNPSDPIEHKLVGIWSDILKRDQAQIGVENHFFELGGHSLLLMPLLSRVEQEFNVPIELKELFERLEISSMANYISNKLEILETTRALEQLSDGDAEELEW